MKEIRNHSSGYFTATADRNRWIEKGHIMLGSRSVLLNADYASFAFGYDDFPGERLKEINIWGRTGRGNAPNIAGISFCLRVLEASEDSKIEKIRNPHEENPNEEAYWFGDALLAKADENTKEKTMFVDLLIPSTWFSHLKDILDKFFIGAVELKVSIGIAGKELGFEAWWDEFPPEKNLPVVAYRFSAHSKEKAI